MSQLLEEQIRDLDFRVGDLELKRLKKPKISAKPSVSKSRESLSVSIPKKWKKALPIAPRYGHAK